MIQTIGRHFILGFQGPTLPKWIEGFAKRYGLGGIILFDYDCQTKTYENNIASVPQLKDLCSAIHGLPDRPLIYIDQEGGKVRRLKENKGFAPLASAKSYAQLSGTEAYNMALASFQQMKQLGIDVNLAPVIDLDLNPSNPNIGAIERSFSSDPKAVRKNWEILNRAAQQTGLKLCLKHYPGLGGAVTDSHTDLTVLTETIPEAQFKLFYELAPQTEGNAILVSHGVYPEINGVLPTSMCKDALDQLRVHCPDTVLISDDLQMQGLLKVMNLADACRQGLHAGLDLLIIGNNLIRSSPEELDRIMEYLADEAKHSQAFVQRLKESKKRMQKTV